MTTWPGPRRVVDAPEAHHLRWEEQATSGREHAQVVDVKVGAGPMTHARHVVDRFRGGRSSRLVTISSQVAIRRPRLWMTGPRGQVCATGHEDGAAEGSRSLDTSGTTGSQTGRGSHVAAGSAHLLV